MRKQKIVESNVPLTQDGPTKKARPEGRLSTPLSAYFRSYVKGDRVEDDHVTVFRLLKAKIDPKTVLYPGCHRHITPSFFFSNVHYVDCDAKVGGLYSDKKALAFIQTHKEYPENPTIRFSCKNYEAQISTPNSVDLMISLSAGIVSTPCGQYLKPGGYLFVNDSHNDARAAYLDKRFKLVSVYNEATHTFDDDDQVLAKQFHTEDGKAITPAMLKESIEKPRAKRSFTLKVENRFYLFQKQLQKKRKKLSATSDKPTISNKKVCQTNNNEVDNSGSDEKRIKII